MGSNTSKMKNPFENSLYLGSFTLYVYIQENKFIIIRQCKLMYEYINLYPLITFSTCEPGIIQISPFP